MKKPKKIPPIVAVIAARNESGTIADVVRSVKKQVSVVVVIDDGSTDDTGALAKKAGAVVVRHSLNLGQGASLETGFEYVRRYCPPETVVITFDADKQFVPSEIPVLVAAYLKNNVDIVLGSRFLGAAPGIPWLRMVLLQLGVWFTQLFSELKVTDTHNGFRLLGPRALAVIRLQHNRMAHASELLDIVGRTGLRYTEVPVTVRYYSDRKGQRNIDTVKIMIDLLLEKFEL